MSNLIWHYSRLGSIFVLVFYCGLAFAQNNNVTVDGTVNVNGQVSVDGPVQIDVGESPNGNSNIVSENNYRRNDAVSGFVFDNTEGVPGANNNYFGYLFQDQSTWYTPNFFTWERIVVVEPFDVHYKSRFGYAEYTFNQRFGVSLILPVPDWNELEERFSTEIFGCSKNILFTKWSNLFTYRGTANISWKSENYMPNYYGAFEYPFEGKLNFTGLTTSGTWVKFGGILKTTLNLFICIGYFIINCKLLTSW